MYAERRSRYTKAVEQLANEKAAVRLGGIYTLVGLADEWLADDSLTKDKQNEEGQVIINNLCSYIRSPFPLAAKIEEYEAHKELEKLQKSESGKLSEEESLRLQILIKRFEDSDEYEKPKDITTDYAKFHEEQDVRRTIFVEMSKRSSTFTKNDKGEIIETVPGIWSDFDFDFSRAPIFYSLSSLTIEKGNFSSAKFYSKEAVSYTHLLKNVESLPQDRKDTLNGEAEIRRLIFSELSDRLSKSEKDKYAEEELLSAGKEIPITRGPWSKFNFNFTQAPIFYPLVNLTIENSDFKDATFYPNSLLININFHGIADFSYSTFTYKPYLRYIRFYDYTRFVNVNFKQGASFNHVTFCALTDFSASRFRKLTQFLDCTFWGYALFLNTRFRCRSEFRGVKFKESALFNKSIFKYDTSFESIDTLGEISFRESIFMKTADFYNIGIGKKLLFQNSQFHGKFKINYILNFNSVNFISDLFSYKKTHVFGADKYSASAKKLFYSGFSKVGFEKDSVTYTHTIPSSTRLFDPDSWDEQNKEYTRVSKPAK